MKTLLVFSLLSFAAFAGQPNTTPPPPEPMLDTDGIAVGAEYIQHVRPFIGEFHKFADHMYSYTQISVTSFSRQPLRAQTILTTGLCGIVNIYKQTLITGGCLEGGISNSDQNYGGVVGTDPFVILKLKKGFSIMVMGGFLKTALDTSQAPIKAAILYSWK